VARRPSTSRPAEPPSLKAWALRALAQREYSRAELRRRLSRQSEAEPAEIDALLDALERDGWLSEARFVESRVRLRSARLGTARIAGELARHGVALPPESAAHLAATESERARAVWQRRFGVAAVDAAERARQARFLIARGFAADVVRRIIRGVDDEVADSGA
jgi:regulatory protein